MRKRTISPEDEVLIERIVQAVNDKRITGIGWGKYAYDIARISIRRWRSFARRNKSHHPTRKDRIDDIAKGLKNEMDKMFSNSQHETDYWWAAYAAATILDPE